MKSMLVRIHNSLVYWEGFLRKCCNENVHNKPNDDAVGFQRPRKGKTNW